MSRRRAIVFLITLFSIVIVVLGIRYAFYEGYLRLNYPSFEEYPIHGIDVSHHQKIIDWQKLDKKYTQFAFIKATEGATHQDTLFRRNYTEAKKLNIPVSVYHFFTFCTSGKEQAENFIQNVPKDSLDMPPAIDLEFDGNCQKVNHKKDLVKEIAEYIDTIEAYYNKKVIIYTIPNFYNQYILNNFKENPIWIRDIYRTPELTDRKWMFWQYANKGRLDGIETFVDLNVFAGNDSDFRKLIEN